MLKTVLLEKLGVFSECLCARLLYLVTLRNLNIIIINSGKNVVIIGLYKPFGKYCELPYKAFKVCIF